MHRVRHNLRHFFVLELDKSKPARVGRLFAARQPETIDFPKLPEESFHFLLEETEWDVADVHHGRRGAGARLVQEWQGKGRG